MVLTGSSIFALLSFAFQDGLLGTRFNWAAPSVFSGVSALSLWAFLYVLFIVLPYRSCYFWESWGSRICRGPNLLLRSLGQARGNNISKAFLSYDGCISFFCVNG